jgi:hypothetical protein
MPHPYLYQATPVAADCIRHAHRTPPGCDFPESLQFGRKPVAITRTMNSSDSQRNRAARHGLRFAALTALFAGVLLADRPAIASAANAADLTLQVPPGETRLSEIGFSRVAWQSVGKAPVYMPPGWRGHFDEATGISCQNAGQVLGREALLLHSPWRVPPGRTWVEYQLALPKVTPIRLAFGIAMGPGRVGPELSDGVTFSGALTVAGVETELMSNHYTKETWFDYAFDLSAHAGQVVTLRLQVEPGPTMNSSFDYSYFGDARIIVGDSTRSPADLVRQLTAQRAYQATATANRTALSNTPRQGVVPSNLLPFTNTLHYGDDGWTFTYQGADGRVVYTYEPKTGTLDDFTVQLDDSPPFQPALGGGATVEDGDKTTQVLLRAGKFIKQERAGDTLKVTCEYQTNGHPYRLAWTFRIVGKALVVSVSSETAGVSGFSLGNVGPGRSARPSLCPISMASYVICLSRTASSAGCSTGQHPMPPSARVGWRLMTSKPMEPATCYAKQDISPCRRTSAKCSLTFRSRPRRFWPRSARGSCSMCGAITKAAMPAMPRNCAN